MPLRAEILHVSATCANRLAVDAGHSAQLTYAELMGAAHGLSAQLENCRAVGVLSNRRVETYVAVLACFLPGITFVPLNPGFPQERLQKITRLAELDLVLHDATTADLATTLGTPILSIPDPVVIRTAGLDETPLSSLDHDPAAIAYRMFTSGSTGEPKGVPIPYGALDHYVRTIRDRIAFPEAARFSQLFDLSFDLSIHDIFVTLASGGTIVPASDLNLLMPHSYAARRQIDVWFSVPMLAMSAARGLRGEPEHKLSLALFCGEALPMDYVRRFRALMEPEAELWNLYGPTEATIAFTAKLVDETDERHTLAPLGEPFGDNHIAILKEDGAVISADEGAHGELLLGGPQVFDGYQPPRHDPFVESDTGRFYRSGDIVGIEDGELVYEGRADSQVKIRGMRIELAEIENAFRNALGCDSAAAFVHGELEEAEIRVAYTKADGVAEIDQLNKTLPHYMIPALCWRVDELPVNANGKVDRRKLAEMDWSIGAAA